MATVIRSAGSLFEGDSSAELITIESGGIARTTVEGAGGSDTISILVSGDGAVTSTRLVGQGGGDLITLSGADIDDGFLLGGAGSDTIQDLGLGALDNTEVKAGDGSDFIFFSGEGNLSGGTTIAGGSGADSITLSVAGITGSTIDAGSGLDTITVGSGTLLSAASIFGGGGNDNVFLSGVMGRDTEVNGDSTVNGGGNDTITIGEMGAATTVQGKGGDDEITVSGVSVLGSAARLNAGAGSDEITVGHLGNSSYVLGANGSDQITFSGFAGDKGKVLGGSGADTITFSGIGADQASSNSVYGGGGTDSISLDQGAADFKGTGNVIYGGAGADTIETNSVFSGGIAAAAAGAATGYIGFESLSDSSIDAVDKISGNANVSGMNFTFDTAAGVTSFTIGSYSDSDATTPSITAGIVSGATFQSADGTLTSRATEIDAVLSTKGTLVGFQAGGEDYIFIQGGSSGVSDDAIIEVDSKVTGFTVNVDYEFYTEIG